MNILLPVAASAPPLLVRPGKIRRGLACTPSVCCNFLSCSAVSFWLDSLSPPLPPPHHDTNTISTLPQHHLPNTAIPQLPCSAYQQKLRGKVSSATLTESQPWWRPRARAECKQPATQHNTHSTTALELANRSQSFPEWIDLSAAQDRLSASLRHQTRVPAKCAAWRTRSAPAQPPRSAMQRGTRCQGEYFHLTVSRSVRSPEECWC